MKCTKTGSKKDSQIWKGHCRQCKSEFEAERIELNISRCPRDGYEFAHSDCSECGAKSGNALILYPQPC